MLTPKSIAAILLCVQIASGARAQTTPRQPGANLLDNPGHEQPARTLDGRNDVVASWGWQPFWRAPDPAERDAQIPVFRPPFAQDDPAHVHGGAGADRWFNYLSINAQAGLSQTVGGLPLNATLRFSSWVLTISDSGARMLRTRLCVDQNGGPLDADSSGALICSPWAAPAAGWSQVTIDATVRNPSVTVYLMSAVSEPREHNEVFVDDSCLELLSSPADRGICIDAPRATSTVRAAPSPTPGGRRMTATPVVTPRASTTPVAGAIKPPPNNRPAVAVNARSVLNIRENPSADAAILARAPRGSVLNVIGRTADGQWYRVATVDATPVSGWAFAALVTPNALALAAPVVRVTR